MRRGASRAIALVALASACTPRHTKPVASADLVAASTPRLAELLASALKDETVDGLVVRAVALRSADLFSEGHVHETWRLSVDLDGRAKDLVLKVFPDAAQAAESALNYGFAQQYGWPVPAEVVRGPSASPIRDRPFVLMEFVKGGTLRAAVSEALASSGAGDPSAAARASASLYGVLGRELGVLHHRSLRRRERFDPSGVTALDRLLQRCAEDGWCDEDGRARLKALAPSLDGPHVAFVHGDLYESQVIMDGPERIRAFIDLDESRFDDPARDVGSVLCHLLLVNPAARPAAWGVPAPTLEETEASAQAFMAAYRESFQFDDADWAELLTRAQAFLWIRLGELVDDLAGSPHGQPIVAALTAGRAAMLATDPFRDHGLVGPAPAPPAP